ncbi:MAG: SBBP repeat-containing protein [Chloroflexi bacterium]|nr:SBBP repeat-containing protein [Chloroflexota bacterium]
MEEPSFHLQSNSLPGAVARDRSGLPGAGGPAQVRVHREAGGRPGAGPGGLPGDRGDERKRRRGPDPADRLRGAAGPPTGGLAGDRGEAGGSGGGVPRERDGRPDRSEPGRGCGAKELCRGHSLSDVRRGVPRRVKAWPGLPWRGEASREGLRVGEKESGTAAHPTSVHGFDGGSRRGFDLPPGEEEGSEGDSTFVHGFEVKGYDPAYPLILDPGLEYSTFLGGSSRDEGYGIALDAAGNAYVTGGTSSSDFPTTVGAFDRSYNGGEADVFVAKLNSDGSALLYATFLGGNGVSEWGSGIALDAAGNAYITGRTYSSDFPTTAGAFDTSYNGGYDAFVARLSLPGAGCNHFTARPTFAATSSLMPKKLPTPLKNFNSANKRWDLSLSLIPQWHKPYRPAPFDR